MKKLLQSFYFRLFVTLLLLFLAFNLHSFDKNNWSHLHFNIFHFFIILVVALLSNLSGNYSWVYIVWCERRDILLYDLFASYWKGLFYNQLLPTGIGGDLIKGVDIISKYKNSYFFISSIFLDRLINFLLLQLMGIIAFLIYFNQWLFLIYFVILFTLFIIISLFFYKLFLLKFIKKYRTRRKTYQKFTKAFILLKVLLKKKKKLLLVLFYAFISQFLKIFVTYLLGQSFKMNYEFIVSVFAVPIQATFALIPISINGIGLREYSNTLFEHSVPINLQDLSVVSLIGYFIYSLASLPALYYFYQSYRQGKNYK